MKGPSLPSLPKGRQKGHSQPQQQHTDILADFSKLDSILRHLQQTQSNDWLGEISQCVIQVCYLLLQNYNISRFNFYNYNFHLITLTVIFFAQRLWFFLWRVAQFSEAHGPRFVCNVILVFVLLDSLYCATQLVLKDSMVGSVYLATPLLSSVLFYHVYLKSQSNVFTAELFGMFSRCVYHSVETGYCIGVLPLRFLQYEHIYYDTSRCCVLTLVVIIHTFLMLFCLELHCLGSEVLQQARMLGEWRSISDPTTIKSISSRAAEWAAHGCPYPRGAVVRCKGRYYEAMCTHNTCSPTSPSQCINPVTFVLGDARNAQIVMLAALLLLNVVLVQLVVWSSHWALYAVVLIPNCLHVLYVKYRKAHAFFNPAHLNMSRLQWDLNISLPPYHLNGTAGAGAGSIHANQGDYINSSWGTDHDDVHEENARQPPYDDEYVHTNGNGQHFGDVLSDLGLMACLQYPNPLFMSAVSASTLFFFGPAGQELAGPGLPRQEDGVGNGM
mmetsp:Transcript_74257/g.138696  ORF Transcript_74257/g.138696 Transcript_74257/m.138696 type:complete len:499 (-) Transcript_74257:88-1584(-)